LFFMDLNTTLILALICIVIGLMLGMLIASFRTGREGQTSQPAPEARSQSATDRLPGSEVQLHWDQDGRLVVTIDDQAIPASQALSPEQQRQLIKAVVDLQAWLASGPPGTPAEDKMPVSALPAQQQPAVKEQDEAGRPSLNPFKIFERAITTTEGATQSSLPKSIASQVDEILQEKLAGTPLENRAIRLLELPGQGMVVMIGLTKYDELDKVPDLEIRRLIQQSVAEWERRMTDKPVQ
jgi:FtsZ-interacting cell division protein ZipA